MGRFHLRRPEKKEYRLDSPPVWDGMAVADKRLYLSTVADVLCFDEKMAGVGSGHCRTGPEPQPVL